MLKALETGLVDSVQVVYNVFDQAPEDELFPACQQAGMAVIARVPFDEGSLTGTLTPGLDVARGRLAEPLLHSGAPARDARRASSGCDRSCPPGSTLPDLALRFILHHPAVSTTIPGMRRAAHVEANLAAGDAPPLPRQLVDALRGHRWEREWRVP